MTSGPETLAEKVARFVVNPDIPQEIRDLVEQQLDLSADNEKE